jgi:hypothetical protein
MGADVRLVADGLSSISGQSQAPDIKPNRNIADPAPAD